MLHPERLERLVHRDCYHPINGPLGVETVANVTTHWLDMAYRKWSATPQVVRELLTRNMSSAPALPEPMWPQNKASRKLKRCYSFQEMKGRSHRSRTSSAKLRPMQWRTTWCAHEGQWPTGQQTSRHGPPVSSSCLEPISKKNASYPGGAVLQGGAAYNAFLEQPHHGFFYCEYELRPIGTGVAKLSDGVVALLAGATLQFDVELAGEGFRSVTAKLNYLVSHQGMGIAKMECILPCICGRHVVDAHVRTNDTVYREHSLQLEMPQLASDPGLCTVQIQVLKRTSSTAHKFKVRYLTLVYDDDHE